MERKITFDDIQKNDYYYDEAIKTLRTNIQFCGSNVKVIMFTSTVPDEGKSDTAFALAQSLGDIGKKVVLLDADIRKSVMIKRHGVKEKTNGLSQYLSGQMTAEDIIYQTNLENLDVVLSGPYSPNPTKLLEEPLFQGFLEELRNRYDYVIIDTPPMGNLIDGAIVANLCDGAVLVVESGLVSYRLIQKVKEQLERSGCQVLGAVLNRVGSEQENSFYKKYYGRYYGKYGKYRKYDAYSQQGIEPNTELSKGEKA